jgi:hypothetical protein
MLDSRVSPMVARRVGEEFKNAGQQETQRVLFGEVGVEIGVGVATIPRFFLCSISSWLVQAERCGAAVGDQFRVRGGRCR